MLVMITLILIPENPFLIDFQYISLIKLFAQPSFSKTTNSVRKSLILSVTLIFHSRP